MTGNSYVTGRQITLGTIEVGGRFNRTTRFGVRDLGMSWYVLCRKTKSNLQLILYCAAMDVATFATRQAYLKAFRRSRQKVFFNVS